MTVIEIAFHFQPITLLLLLGYWEKMAWQNHEIRSLQSNLLNLWPNKQYAAVLLRTKTFISWIILKLEWLLSAVVRLYHSTEQQVHSVS